MPKYTFVCPDCGRTEQTYTSRTVKVLPCISCTKDPESIILMKRKLPKLYGNPDITEVVDDYSGKTIKQDQSTMIKERRDKYYWSVEVPRKVASGTYGVDTMLELGWVWFDDDGKMHVNDKPPHER